MCRRYGLIGFLALAAVAAPTLAAQDVVWRNYEARARPFVQDSAGCARRAREITDGMSARSRVVEYGRCMQTSGWRKMTIRPAHGAACDPVVVKPLQLDSAFARVLHDGFVRRFRPAEADEPDIRLELWPTRAGLIGGPVGETPSEEVSQVAHAAQGAVEAEIPGRLALVASTSAARYLVTLRASCVREFANDGANAEATVGDPRAQQEATVSTAGIDFPYPGYLNNIVRQIALRFDPPTHNAALRAEVTFLIHRDGSVSNIRFLERSSVYGFDLEAESAIEAAAAAHAFGPFPRGFSGDVLPVVKSFGQQEGRVRTASDGAYFEFQVEKTALAMPGNPAPVYPSMLHSAGAEGRVLAQFVVDASGIPDVSTLKVLETSHELFAQAVRDALPKMRFFPAEIGGTKVRQVIQQPFTFAISK